MPKTQLNIILILFFSCFCSTLLTAQPNVGVTYTTPESLEGYTFFSPFSGTKAYIVDNCGRLVNEWERGTRPGLAAYFLDIGLMLRTYKPPLEGPFTSASNAGGLELVDWDNNTVWHYEHNTPTELSHHDAVYMPNGHILMLTWQLKYTDDLVAWGRDPNEIAVEGYMWSERIIEVEIVGTNDINILWEWHIKDHYIQDFDPTKENYGVIAEHPELFNINYPDLNSGNSNSTRDWNHINAIDYNAALDQILLSVRNSDEIWILDHSTTTAEAATHSGGLQGKGGDILYRWGNASAYERAPVSDQKLFGQHGVHWIKEGQHEGKILIFNNGNGRPGPDYSTVEILVPTQDANGGYILPDTEPFGPETTEWSYGDGAGENFYSAYLSNAQILSNGNILINAGSPGDIFEIDMDKNIVWEYTIPLNGDTPVNDGEVANNNGNFRAYKFPADYTGFSLVDLSPGDLIENISDPLGCAIFPVAIDAPMVDVAIEINYFFNKKSVAISHAAPHTSIAVFDRMGTRLFSKKINAETYTIDVSSFSKGLYIIQLAAPDGGKLVKKVMVF